MVGAVEPLFAVPSDGDEAGLTQQRQVPGDARVREVEPFYERPDREFFAPDVPEDLLAAGLGDQLKRVHHDILPLVEMSGTFA